MSLEPAPEVWVHGLLPLPGGSNVTEESLLKVLELPRMPSTDLVITLEQWHALAAKGLSLPAAHATAVMRLCVALSQPADRPEAMAVDDAALRAPLGSLLLLLWVQWAHHELGESSATNVHRAQAASGEVWPSLLLPPAAAASATLIDGNAPPSARTLAVQTRLQASMLTRLRRKLLQNSLPALLQLAGAGAERVYATELDRIALLIRPEAHAAARLVARGLRPTSIAAALGLWTANPKAALPVNELVKALRAALVEMAAPFAPSSRAKPPPPAAAARSPLSSTLPAPPTTGAAAGAGTPTGTPPATPLTPTDGALPPRPTVSTSDREERETPTSLGSLATCAEGGADARGLGVVRLQGAKRRTIVLKDHDLRGGTLQLIDCHACYVYVLAAVRAVEVLGCCGCTLMVGACSHIVSISHCDGVKLVAATKAIRVANCNETVLQLCVNSAPMIWGENHRLRLAPFATVYASLEEHLAAACIQTGLTSNFWARPVLMTTTPTSASVGGGSGSTPLGTDRTVAFSADGSEALALLPPARFMPFHVPFDVPPAVARGEGAAPICEVPPEYARALTGHVAKIGKLRDELSALRCTDEVRREVQATLHAGFKDWLQRTGNARQITDLMAMQTW